MLFLLPFAMWEIVKETTQADSFEKAVRLLLFYGVHSFLYTLSSFFTVL